MTNEKQTWADPKENPERTGEFNALLSKLEQAKNLLEDHLKQDEASLKVLKLELARLKAQKEQR